MTPADDADSVPAPQAVARTYETPRRDDPWEAVVEYQEVMAVAAEHPDKGSAALSAIVDLPRGRIRGWIDNGGMPDPARAVQVAEKRGLLVRELNSRDGAALAGLSAWIFSGGSILERNYTPQFAIDSQVPSASRTAIEILLDEFGYTGRVNDRNDGRADEIVPEADRTVLGRVLAAAGSPVGTKTTRELSVPEWVRTGPECVQQTFTFVYLSNRGTRTGEGDVLQLREDGRSELFHAELADLFEAVAGTGSVIASENHVRVDQAATKALSDLLTHKLSELLPV